MACKDCFSGFMHAEEPKGKAITLHDLPTYVAEPTNDAPPKGFIVMHMDAFGWDLPNARVLADHWAERSGCRVYIPDFFLGHGVQHDLLTAVNYMEDTQPTWTATLWKIFHFLRILLHASFVWYCRFGVVQPRTVAWLKALRSHEAKDLPVGMAGFCWGAQFVFAVAKNRELAADGQPLLVAGFTAHPSMVQVPLDGQEARIPISTIVGDHDTALPLAKAEQLRDVMMNSDVGHEMVILPGIKHGFAVRWNPHVAKDDQAAKQAEDQAITWFKRQFRL